MWFLSRTKNFEFLKNLCEHVRLCIILEEKGNMLVIIGIMVSWVKVMLNVLFAWNNNKNEGMS
jgi:hypothetical protein